MSENIPHSLGGFRGAFESEHGRKPTEQEIWNAAIRSWRDITRQKSDSAKELEEVIADLLMYAGDNGYGHIDYADTMRHAAALLQSTALPEADQNAPWLTKAHMLCTDHGVPQGGIEWRLEVLRELFEEDGWKAALASARSQPTTEESLVVAGAQPVGELPAPFHPSASHINPDYRDGWNAALAAARSRPVREPLGERQTPFANCRFQICDLPGQC